MAEAAFPDVEVDLMDWLEVTVPALAQDGGPTRVGTVTPDRLLTRVPYVRVNHIDGSGGFVTDYPVVDIDVFAETRDAARFMAESIRQELLVARRVGSAVLDRVDTTSSPRRLPWDEDRVWRYGATYQLSFRRSA